MIVLVDLEWIEEKENHLTQLSAIRTDEHWNALDRLNLFAKPSPGSLIVQSHMALGGYTPEHFETAFSVDECMTGFRQWLRADDIIIVWAKSNMRFLSELWEQQMSFPMPRIISTANKVRGIALKRNYSAQSPYALLARLGEELPCPEHRASNDVEVLRRVFSGLGISLSDFEKKAPTPQKPKLSQRERNQKLIDNSQYNYLYLKGSEVFHRRSCKACLSAKSQTEILGSVYYDTAAKGRRPCKLCKPVPLLLEAPITDKELAYREKLKSRQLNDYTKEIIKVKMLTGNVISIRRGHVLGWCHHELHPGAISKAIMDDHDCLGKNCPFLERNCQSPFWSAYEAQQESKEKRKEKLREQKLKKAQEERELLALTENWRSRLAELGSDMHIVRVSKDTQFEYRIFYVSDNSFADGNRFPEFLATLKTRHPHFRFFLRHIRDLDGHFVTREEYRQRCRK